MKQTIIVRGYSVIELFETNDNSTPGFAQNMSATGIGTPGKERTIPKGDISLHTRIVLRNSFIKH